MGIRVAGSREDLLNPEDGRIVSPGDGIVYLALQPIPEPSSAG
jgi:hypothetical protein